MFYFLITIASIFIGIGVYKDRKKIIAGIFLWFERTINKDELTEMEKKINELEKKLEESSKTREMPRFNSEVSEPIRHGYGDKLPFTDIDIDLSNHGFQEVYEEVLSEKNGLSVENKIKLVQEYEAQNKSVDEICKLMDMKKGELLLLKKLYKKS